MLTAAETTKLRRIKDMALRGLAHEVSREDKQWVLDISAREGTKQDIRVLAKAAMDGYDVSACVATM